MKDHTGMVTQMRSVDFNGTPLWSFQLDEDKTWYRTGKEKCVAEGDHVSFTEKNAQVLTSTLEQVGAVPVAPQSTAPSASASTPIRAASVDEVGRRIQWQAARRDACNIIVACLAIDTSDKNGVLPWATNVAKGKKLDLLRGYINELTKQFIEEETNG